MQSDGDDGRRVLDYAGGPLRKRSWQITWVGWTIVLLIVMALLALLLPTDCGSAPGLDKLVKCASNLQQIGKAVSLYAADHRGQYPDSFETLLTSEQMSSAVFVCPGSSDTPAIGPTAQAQATQLSTGGHCSYIYVGRGLTAKTVTPDTVVVYEPLANHSTGRGINVLFGDGHVDYVVAQTAGKIIAAAATGRFPVTMPSGQ
jgi:prepilin-type processing-associated H-X9-DG protein